MSDSVFLQNDGSAAVLAVTPCGIITPEQLAGLSSLVQKLCLPALKLTTRQTLILLCKPEQIETVKEGITSLGLQVGGFNGVIRNVKGCCGTPNLCKRYLGDALGLGIKIQGKYLNSPVPKDFKISTAGCSRGCTDPYCADFGVIASGKNLFNVYLGGRGGGPKPQHGKLIADKVSETQVLELLAHVLEVYKLYGEPHERIFRTIRRIGIDPFTLSFQPQQNIDQNFLAFLGGGPRVK